MWPYFQVENSNERDGLRSGAPAAPHSNVHYGSVNQGHGDCTRAPAESFRIQDKERKSVCFPLKTFSSSWLVQPTTILILGKELCLADAICIHGL